MTFPLLMPQCTTFIAVATAELLQFCLAEIIVPTFVPLML